MESSEINIYKSINSLNTHLRNFSSDKKIVYTYGAWDLLHPGHIRLLFRAKKLGDFLIVGVIKDSPIKKLKGENRPVQSFEERQITVGSVRFVDAVIEQPEYDPSLQLKEISKVDILTKGDDWEYIPGTETIQLLGGKLVKLGYSQDFSTSSIVSKISGKEVAKKKEF